MISTRDDIIDRLNNIEDLPTIPVVMAKLNKALADPDCSAAQVELILLTDPTISTRILKTVNSPLFAAQGVRISRSTRRANGPVQPPRQRSQPNVHHR